MSEQRSAPHVLVITAYWPDDDIYDYEVRHPATCPREVISDSDLGGVGTSYYHYTCLVQHELDHVGLDGLTECGDKRIEPGKYVIEGWSIYYPSTPYGGGDADGGLRFLGGDGNSEPRPIQGAAIPEDGGVGVTKQPGDPE